MCLPRLRHAHIGLLQRASRQIVTVPFRSFAAPAEALVHFEEAVRLYIETRQSQGLPADPDRLALLHEQIAEAHFVRGEMAEAVAAYSRALACIGELPTQSRVAHATRPNSSNLR